MLLVHAYTTRCFYWALDIPAWSSDTHLLANHTNQLPDDYFTSIVCYAYKVTTAKAINHHPYTQISVRVGLCASVFVCVDDDIFTQHIQQVLSTDVYSLGLNWYETET